MSSTENKREQLLKAGLEYEAILELLRKHQQDYRRLVIDIGVREQHLNQKGQRAIELPDMPSTEEQEGRIADNLLSMAAQLAHRTGRVTPCIKRDEVAGLVPLKTRTSAFSPDRLAQELASEMLGAGGERRVRYQAAQHLKSHFGPHLNVGAACCLAGVQVIRNEAGRMIDTINSLRLADWLTSFTAVLEALHLPSLLAGVDSLIEEIDCVGRLTVESQQTLEDGEYVIRISLRKDLLRVYLSEALLEKVRHFVEENSTPVTPAADGNWFRALSA